ncbi:MAG: deoxynucleoside kinase [Anaerolineales bacterium]|jgi:deoxyadenosine/deoxycytidine kinase
MGKLITVVGNSGIGKTTLATKLCEAAPFIAFLEKTDERPFQRKFQDDLKSYSLPNQVDFLLFRAEQEIYIREHDIVGVQDGGLDQDFHVFTKHFHRKTFLDAEEYRLCGRLYSTLRRSLPPPDLIIHLTAPVPILTARMAKRERNIEIAKSKDLAALQNLIEEWLSKNSSIPAIHVDATGDDPSYSSIIEDLIVEINSHLK